MERRSARALAGRGFDVWIAEYRSTDSATPPPGSSRWDYGLDDIANQDLPAIIDALAGRGAAGSDR